MSEDLDHIICLALELPEDARAAYLNEVSGGDAARRAQLEAKLAELQAADDFFREPETVIQRRAVVHEGTGTMIGPYKLLQQIGEGGFGTVWMAEQQQPVRRRVALKIIKAGMDTREVVARFEQERQALAMMDHPNIARVFDAGATESGRLYFVMELVKGIPITRFCDEQRLPVKERLALFNEVCFAIQHAHQKGIIHRDIKPSNIMVALLGDQPVLKVIDFGIAKATQQSLTDRTLFPRFEQFIGTPAYMSPEQASGGAMDIDTRSDIYALGILLYELLTGKPPFDPAALLSAGYDEMRRVICEDEPPRPSVRLSTVAGADRTQLAKSHQVEPARLGNLIRGDLDWIVMRAIEKDRTRRYDSANALVADIRHFLADEPVSATPPGTAYLFCKYARRHRLAFAVSAAVAASLVLGLAVSTWMYFKENAAHKRAVAAEDLAGKRLKDSEAARQEAAAVSKFLVEVFKSPTADDGGPGVTVAELLDKAAAQLPEKFKDQPLQKGSMTLVLASCYNSLILPGKAIKMLDELMMERGSEPWTDQEKIPVFSEFAEAYRLLEQFERAAEYCGNLKKLTSETKGPEDEATIKSQLALGACHLMMAYAESTLPQAGRVHQKKAAEELESALEICRKNYPSGHSLTVTAMEHLAELHSQRGGFDAGIALASQALAMSREINGEQSPLTLSALSVLGLCYFKQGRDDEALKLVTDCLAIVRKKLGNRSPHTAVMANALALILEKSKRSDEAIPLWQESLSINPEQPGLQRWVGLSLLNRRRWAEALPPLQMAKQFLTGASYQIELEAAIEECRKNLDQEEAGAGLRGMTLAEYVSELETKTNGRANDSEAAKLLCHLYLWQGRPADHGALCRIVLDSAKKSNDATTLERAAKSCLVYRELDPILQKEGIELARRSLAADDKKNGNLTSWCQLVAGLAAYREGNDEEADRLLSEVVAFHHADAQIPAHIYRALVRWRLKQKDKARLDIDAVKNWMQPVEPNHLRLTGRVINSAYLFYWLAYLEAVETLKLEPVKRAMPPPLAASLDEKDTDVNLPAKRFRRYVELRERRLAEGPADSGFSKEVALLYLWEKRFDDHTSLCRKILETAAQSREFTDWERGAKACLVRRGLEADLQARAVDFAYKALAATSKDNELRPWCELSTGMAAYREGKDDEAEQHFTEATRSANWEIKTPALLYRVMSRLRKGRIEDAEADFKEAKLHLPPLPEDRNSVPDDFKNVETLFAWLVYDEVKEVIESLPEATPSPPSSPSPLPQ